MPIQTIDRARELMARQRDTIERVVHSIIPAMDNAAKYPYAVFIPSYVAAAIENYVRKEMLIANNLEERPEGEHPFAHLSP